MEQPATSGGEDVANQVDSMSQGLGLEPFFQAGDKLLEDVKAHMAFVSAQYTLIERLAAAGVVDKAVAYTLRAGHAVSETRNLEPLIFQWVDNQGVTRGGGIRIPHKGVTGEDSPAHTDVVVFAYGGDSGARYLEPLHGFSDHHAQLVAQALGILAQDQHFGLVPPLTPDFTQLAPGPSSALGTDAI